MNPSATPYGLHPLDWTIVAVYCLGMIAIGYYFSRRQSGSADYFLGGSRMPSWVMGISLFVTLFSTISYLSMPGEMIKHGPTYLFIFLAIPFAYLVVGYVLIPAFMRHRVISAYELLEARLGGGVRTLGAGLFITLRLVWMAVLLYMASAAITVIIGLPVENIIYVLLATGIVSVVYTTLGGLRAVAISDVAQSLILFLGALCTLGIVTVRLGGISWVPTEWNPQWQSQPFFSFDPHVRVTVVGVVIMNFFWQLCTAGGDQTAIQRYMSTRDAASARRAFLIHSIMGVVVSLLVCLIGFALMAYYTRFPELLPVGTTIAGDADRLFPSFISSQFPIGMCGLVVAALFAAAMSSLDSGVNSITAVVSRDLLERGARPMPDHVTQVRRARVLALVIGGTAIALATQVGNIPGSFLEITKKTTNLFAAPIFGLFVLALFMRRAGAFGATIGTVYGLATGSLVAYWDVLTGSAPISMMWIIPPSLGMQLLVAALLGSRPSGLRQGWAIWTLALLPLAVVLAGLLLTRLPS